MTRKPFSMKVPEELAAAIAHRPSEPAPPAPAPRPAPVAAPATRMPIEVWIRVSGLKPDQTAGFLRYAKAKKMAPASAADWVRRHLDFLARPV